MILKTLDRLVIKSFIGPYLFSFFVAEFVLVMQFLWKYIDELVGKGLSFWFLVKMVFYYSVTIIPLAVPITILISSVMVYGNMGEKYEISSFKSAGVSLLRVMRPGIMMALFTFGFSLLASNYLKPKANLKFFQSFDNVRKQKPSLTLEEGIFNDDFKGFTIKIGKKDPDDIGIHDVMIYDDTDRSYMNLTTAENGKMYTMMNGKYFVMELEDVKQYRELIDKKNRTGNASEFLRSEFKSWKKTFDMSEFEFSEKSSGMSRRKYDLYNTFQLLESIDSLNIELVKNSFKNKYKFKNLDLLEIDSTELKAVLEREEAKANKERERIQSLTDSYEKESKKESEKKEELLDTDPSYANRSSKKVGNNLAKLNKKLKDAVKPVKPKSNRIKTEPSKKAFFRENLNIDSLESLIDALPADVQSSIMFRALNDAQTNNEKIKASINERRMKDVSRRKFLLRLHQIYSWATICLIFIFIGAPLGSIVRKGGYGYPLLIAIGVFMVFVVLMIMGEKLNKSMTLSAPIAAWLPCLVLFPFSVFLSYLALRDIRLNFSFVSDLIARFRKKKAE